MTQAAGRPGLAVAALLVNAALATSIVVISAAPFASLYAALRGPVSFADEVPSVAWLAPPIAALVLLGARLISFVRSRSLSARWMGATIFVLGAVLLGRVVEPARGEGGWTTAHDAPPTVQTVTVLQRLRDLALQGVRQHHAVPDDRALLEATQLDGQPLIPAYVYAGLLRRPFHLVRVPEATGPVEQVLPGDLAGTLYVAVSPNEQKFWLTAVVLLDDQGQRSSDLLPGPAGVTVLTNASPDSE